MAGIRIEGNTSGNVAEVDGNNQMLVVLNANPQMFGGAFVGSNNDDGTKVVGGARFIEYPYSSPDFRFSVGQDTPLANHYFTAAAQDTGKWKCLFTTMTITQSGGFMLLNSNSTATITTGCSLQTWQVFPLQIDGALYGQMTIAFTQSVTAQSGQNFCFGFFVPTSATAETTDGAYFKLTSGGLVGKSINNTNAIDTGNLTAFVPALNQQYKFAILVEAHNVSFWIDDVLYAQLPTPSTLGTPFAAGALPLCYHFFNTGAVVGTQLQARVTNDSVTQLDTFGSRTTNQILPMQGAMGYQGQEGGSMGSTALFANSANPTAAVPTNTTAALGSGLGGNFWSTNTLAVNTDGIISSFQVPLGGVAQLPRTLVVYGVTIDTAVQTALANAGGAVYVWSLAFGHETVTLVTAESGSFANATAKTPRRIAIGQQVAVGALVQGSSLGQLKATFTAPVVVNPGEFIQTVYKNIGTVGTAGTLAHAVTFDCQWV